MDKRLCTNWEQVSAVFDNVDEGEVLKKKGSGRYFGRSCVPVSDLRHERVHTVLCAQCPAQVRDLFGISTAGAPACLCRTSDKQKKEGYERVHTVLCAQCPAQVRDLFGISTVPSSMLLL